MFCNECGNEIDSEDKFCSYCGKAILLKKITEDKTLLIKQDEKVICQCGKEKRRVLKDGVFTGKYLCFYCEIERGFCPICKTPTSKYACKCDYCKSSWLEGILEKLEFSNTENKLVCPKCRSDKLHVHQKGFGVGKAIVGGVLTGGIGLLGGFIGSKKIYITCLKCGNKWSPK